MMETDLRSLLMADASVHGFVADRVNWGSTPQGAPLPAIVLNLASETGGHHMQGPNKLREVRVQIDCYAETNAQVFGLANAVRQAIDGYRDENFQAIFFAGARSNPLTGDDEATRPNRVSADYTIYWS